MLQYICLIQFIQIDVDRCQQKQQIDTVILSGFQEHPGFRDRVFHWSLVSREGEFPPNSWGIFKILAEKNF